MPSWHESRARPTRSRPLDDEDEYYQMTGWPVLSDDFVRGPPVAGLAAPDPYP